MRLNIVVNQEHTEIATAVDWSPDCQLLSCSDDKAICKWGADGEKLGKITTLAAFATSVAWFPSTGKQAPDSFAVCCVDGTFRFVSRSGREDKKFEAHSGAVIVIKFNHDGSAILTAGEDGDVKIWSKSGNARSTLASIGQSVYCACWGPDSDQVLFSNGKMLTIKSVQAKMKQLQWNAHDGIVLCADWNVANGLIVSGGEDCTYKVWDAFGRQLFSSRPLEHVVTALRWSPNGDNFVVGSFNLIRLCDKTGWTNCRERLQAGSMLSIAWTSDGTQFSCASGTGAIVFAQVVDRRLEWKDWEVTLVDPRKIRVQDVANETLEELEFSKDRVVEMGLGFDHLIVTTTSQCFIYNLHNLNTPIIFEIKAPPHFIHICKRHFLTLDTINGLQIISFEGKLLSAPKFTGLRPDFLIRELVSLSPDTLAVVDSVDPKIIQILDTTSGKVQAKLAHSAEVCNVYLNQHNLGPQERIMAFVDRNRDLYIAPVNSNQVTAKGQPIIPTFKLHSHVESCVFNDETNVLVGLADGRLKFWYQPEVAFTDKDLLPLTTVSADAVEYGRGAQLLSYSSNRISVRKVDGSVLFTASPPDIPLLYELARGGRWEECTRLCRHQKSSPLWATLSSMSLAKKHLETSEIALAELNEVSKVEYVQYIKQIVSEEGRQAEMALFRRQPEEAEKILLQATPPLIYRAIKMNMNIFRWNRALELALKHKQHLDTVLAYRQQYLAEYRKDETDPKFIQYFNSVKFDWDDVLSKERNEIEEESRNSKGGGGRK